MLILSAEMSNKNGSHKYRVRHRRMSSENRSTGKCCIFTWTDRIASSCQKQRKNLVRSRMQFCPNCFSAYSCNHRPAARINVHACSVCFLMYALDPITRHTKNGEILQRNAPRLKPRRRSLTNQPCRVGDHNFSIRTKRYPRQVPHLIIGSMYNS